jgi:RNA ligase (TIGR02306 family)
MKLAEIQTINEITPIEGADRIELAKVQGWQSVIQRDQFKVGDRIIFVPIDTVLQPATWNSFLQRKDDPSTPIRVKTVKLKGVYSQGLIFPLTILPDPFFEHDIGVDVSDLIGVSKYEKPIPSHLTGQVAGDFPTHLVSKTDEDNLKSNIEVFEELKEADEVECTLKIDGTSATYIKELDGTFRVCSRNLELKDTESNVHWQMAKKYNIQENLKAGYCIQGEIAGPAIQGNPANLSEVTLFVFNVINLYFRKPVARASWDLAFTGIPSIKLYATWPKEHFLKMSIDDLQSYVNSKFYTHNKFAEGLVFRGIKHGKLMYSEKLQKMLSVKIINQNYKD